LNTLTYASFPIAENNTGSLEIFAFEDVESEDDELPLILAILFGFLLVSILGLAAYFLIRSWWRAWRDNIRWVKILSYILLAPLLLSVIVFGLIGYGYGN
jgi:vacuolar-type H+-ATPase subunit I/STV1